MIEFSGIISESCNIDRRNKVNKKIILPIMLCFIGLVVITVILGLLHNKDFMYALISTIFIGIVAVPLALLLSKKRHEKLKKPTIDTKITIEEGKIFFHNLICDRTKPISKVRKVLDMGEWYYVIFKYGDISNSWICQKNLLTKGTLEEFEKLFEEKVVRKIKE